MSIWILNTLLLSLWVSSAAAHFQVLLPSSDIITDSKTLTLTSIFTHPMEQGPVMPKQFGVMVNGEKENLLKTLQARIKEGKTFFTAEYSLKSPADYIFFLEPAPYWEKVEGKMIIHYTKVIVDAYGAQAGWDKLVGFPVEIEPLVRPYGLWVGNVFQGLVRTAGQPQPFIQVEVEYFNQDHSLTPPSEPFITQVIKTDANGIFTYAIPKAGWWGFAALTEEEQPLGQKVPAELGALIWIRAVEMP